MRLFLFLVIVGLCGSSQAAGRVQSAAIDFVRVDASGKGIVRFDTALVGTPALCDSTHKQDLSFDVSTEAGKAIFSMLLAAKLNGSKVSAQGSGECLNYPNRVEDWDFGTLQ